MPVDNHIRNPVDNGGENRPRTWPPRDYPGMHAILYAAAFILVAIAIRLILSAITTGPTAACEMGDGLGCMTTGQLISTFAPGVLLAIGGLGAFLKSYTVWRAHGPWNAWRASGWVLFVLMGVFLATAGGGIFFN